DLGGRQAVERHGRGGDQVEVVGDGGDVGGPDDDLLGVGAGVPVEPDDQAGDPLAGGQVDAGPGGHHGAGEVPAQPGPHRLVDEAGLVEHAGDDGEVDGVDGRRGHGDPDLAGSGGRDGDVDELDRVGPARGADDRRSVGGGVHRALLVAR